MKFRNILILFGSFVLVSGIVMNGCTRKKVDYLGPEYVSAPSNLSATNLTVTSPVNFVTGACTTTAQFSDRVTYTLTFRGLSSGAVKSFTGLDNKIDVGSSGNIWNGSHDGIYFFRASEQVEVTLSFLRSDFTLKDTITISVVRNYYSDPNLFMLGYAAPFNSFEASTVFPTWVDFNSYKPDAANNPYPYGVYPAANFGISAVDRLKVYRVSGVSSQSDGYFAGGLQFRYNDITNPQYATAFMLPATWTDPSQLYYNIYIWGGPKSSFSVVNLEIHESDATNPSNTPAKRECGGSIIGAFGHDPCTDDGWTYQVPVKHTGWKLVSVKFSDFSRNVAVKGGGSGNNTKEPTRIARIQFGVIANPAFKFTEVMFDHPLISYGAPFDPSK